MPSEHGIKEHKVICLLTNKECVQANKPPDECENCRYCSVYTHYFANGLFKEIQNARRRKGC